jgi:hypothetical protein
MTDVPRILRTLEALFGASIGADVAVEFAAREAGVSETRIIEVARKHGYRTDAEEPSGVRWIGLPRNEHDA